MNVPLLDLKAQHATLKDELLAAVSAVIDSAYFINGPAVGQFEKEVAAYSGTKFGVGVSSGTDALLCVLMSLGIGQGDEVITTPFTFFATAGCIWRAGAKPVFVDIDPVTFNINPSLIERAITPRTRAIMPVHLFGQLADMDAIMAIANRHKLPVIEDAAQAIGASHNGRKAGSFGAAGCFSFFPTKNLGGLGDAGLVVTQDEKLAETMLICRDHGQKPKYFHRFVGGNFRLDTMQAAALSVKLRHLDAWSAKRRANAARYEGLLAGARGVTTPKVAAGNVSIFNQYCIRVGNRDELREHLKARGVGTEVYYPRSMHEQECFRPLGRRTGEFPESERAAAEVLALPIFPELTDEQIDYVAQQIRAFVGG